MSAAASSPLRRVSTLARLNVWSFNLRTEFQDAADGPDGWTHRRAQVAEFIRARRPALVCVQEATRGMLSFLAESLGAAEYGWAGTSRCPGRADEMAGFLFDLRQLEQVRHRTAWLGPPGSPEGQPCWDAALPRTLESMVFRLRAEGPSGEGAGRPVYLRAVNTHLDHVGVEARRRSAELLAESVRRGELELPECVQVVCGDFNSPKGRCNAVYETLTATGTGLRDAAREVRVQRPVWSTIHKFEGVEFADQRGDGTVDLARGGDGDRAAAWDAHHIDWVLWRDSTRLQLRPIDYEVITDCLPSGRYPSDHFPVSATFDVVQCRPAGPAPALQSKL